MDIITEFFWHGFNSLMNDIRKKRPFSTYWFACLEGFLNFIWLTDSWHTHLPFWDCFLLIYFSRQRANVYYPFSRLIHDESLFLHIAAFIFSLTLLYAVFCQLCSKSSGQQPAEEWLKVHKCEVKLFLLCLIHRKIEKWESMNCNVM